jgi:hypothetical protein
MHHSQVVPPPTHRHRLVTTMGRIASKTVASTSLPRPLPERTAKHREAMSAAVVGDLFMQRLPIAPNGKVVR